jgi:isoleucyl-tRNA synthetase
VSRRILDTLRNVYLFFARYANLDAYRYEAPGVPHARRPRMDRWITSRLHSLVASATRDLDALEVSRAGRAIETFVIEDLSNWYVRRSRDRFWAGGMDEDKRAAFDTLHECLETVARLMAPFVPFLPDLVYRGLTESHGGEDSVHLTDWPTADPAAADPALEQRMEDVRRLVRLGRAGRNRANVKTRQPLGRVRITPPAGGEALGDLTAVVLDELNVKAAEWGNPGEASIRLEAKARFDLLGPRFGKRMKLVAQAVRQLPSERIAELERAGEVAIDVEGESHALRRDEVVVSHEDPDGWVLERENGWSVALGS